MILVLTHDELKVTIDHRNFMVSFSSYSSILDPPLHMQTANDSLMHLQIIIIGFAEFLCNLSMAGNISCLSFIPLFPPTLMVNLRVAENNTNNNSDASQAWPSVS